MLERQRTGRAKPASVRLVEDLAQDPDGRLRLARDRLLHGLLDPLVGQCVPGDVEGGIDALLGGDDSLFEEVGFEESDDEDAQTNIDALLESTESDAPDEIAAEKVENKYVLNNLRYKGKTKPATAKELNRLISLIKHFNNN